MLHFCSRALLVTLVATAVVAGRSSAGIPDVSQSYFVPQSGSVATPTEGTSAIALFRACPNNEGGTSLPNNARIKIVLVDANGNPLSHVPREDICILFNGGTSAQGFTGIGADSVIANSTWNQASLCPDVRCIVADAPTDTSGTTFITFAGASEANPGVAVRDPGRKWGHFDAELPVFAMGFRLSGRLTTASANGSYVLRIKNFDLVGGLAPSYCLGAYVGVNDFNTMARVVQTGQPMWLRYWCDLNNSGTVTTLDWNLLYVHAGHDCDTPNNP